MTRPSGSMRSSAVSVGRSMPSRRLAASPESTSGSIGRTRPARYTLVPRSRASTSTGEPSGTKASTSAIETSTRSAPSGPAGITESASSMSVVVGASMVTVGTSRRSRRAAGERGAGGSLGRPRSRRPGRRSGCRGARRSARGRGRRPPGRRGRARPGRRGWRRRPTRPPPGRRPIPSSKGQSVLATTRSTRRKRRRPCAVTVPKSSVRWRSTMASARRARAAGGVGGDGGRDEVAVEEGVEVRRGDERGGVAVGALEVEEAEASGVDGEAAGEAGGARLHDRRHPTSGPRGARAPRRAQPQLLARERWWKIG